MTFPFPLPPSRQRLALAITGASGAAFAIALLEAWIACPGVEHIDLLLSAQGEACLQNECGCDVPHLCAKSDKITLHALNDLASPLSSGSHLHHGMVILPCSAGTLGRIASGVSDSLILRAADVCLKERRPLLLCLRETPLNRIHLDNMLKVHDAGATVMPLMPSYYHRPTSLQALHAGFMERILDQLGLPNPTATRWGACPPSPL